MKTRKDTRQAWRDVCHDLREDDGVDPKELKKEPRRSPRARLGSLCRQVQRELQLALAGCADDVMRDLMVVHVTPAPDATRLRVEVCVGAADHAADDAMIMGRLDRLKGFLRARIADSVNRKRVPDLVFAVMPMPGGDA